MGAASLNRSLEDAGEQRSRLSTTTEGHLAELDGIRGIAILAVLASHSVDLIGIIPGGYSGLAWPNVVRKLFIPGWGGVDLFFTLSGYLITGILLRARARPKYFGPFYARRALRIFPIYYLVLTATLALRAVWPWFAVALPDTSAGVASYFLYVQNWPVFWKSWAGLSALWGVYWSLAVEEQFYLVWPAVVRYFDASVLIVLCVFGFLAGAPERALMIWHLGMHFGIMQWPFSRLDGLFIGAALAFYRQRSGRALSLRGAGWLFGTGAGVWLWIVLRHTKELDGAGGHLWTAGVTAFALMSAGLVAASHHRRPVLHAVLTMRPLLLAGRYSYGMYVYHLGFFFSARLLWLKVIAPRLGAGLHPVATFLFLLSTVLLVVGVAALSFQYVEAPLLRLKRFFPSPAAPV